MKTCPACKKQFDDASEFCPDDGKALEADLSVLAGATLDGQYQIESMLGQGGMGAVFLARHALLGDRVAIKIMPPHIRSNPEYKSRFLREGQAARSFKHPNSVTVYDLRTTSEGMIYMVLEYIEGRTLRAEMEERKRFSASEALELIEPIADALNEAHKAGIVHRDLKPENIMVSRCSDGKPTVKLLDLGIAKMQSGSNSSISVSTALTKVDQVVGTPYYMSPEQWGVSDEANNSTIDGRADIYSLGIVLYEMTAGQGPFNAKTYNELAVAHATVIPPSAHEICPDVPKAFSQAISKAMAKERSKRHAACKDLVGELRAALQDKPSTNEISISTRPTAPLPNLPATAGSKTKYLYIALAVVVILGLFIGGWFALQKADTPEKQSPVKSAADAEEIMRCWLEIASPMPGGPSMRKADDIELAVDQEFKIHFALRRYGYLYIFATGKGNAPTAFLTAKPSAATGATTNVIEAGEEYVFPKGEDNWIKAGKDFGVDKCVVVFSPKLLLSPAFLNGDAGRKLTPDEDREWEKFRAGLAAPIKTIESGNEPAIVLKVPKTDEQPIVFEIAFNRQ